MPSIRSWKAEMMKLDQQEGGVQLNRGWRILPQVPQRLLERASVEEAGFN
jgi:hypothetical protein